MTMRPVVSLTRGEERDINKLLLTCFRRASPNISTFDLSTEFSSLDSTSFSFFFCPALKNPPMGASDTFRLQSASFDWSSARHIRRAPMIIQRHNFTTAMVSRGLWPMCSEAYVLWYYQLKNEKLLPVEQEMQDLDFDDMIDTLPVTMWRIVVVCLMVLPLANSYLEHCQKLPDWSIEGKTLIPSGSVTVVAVLDAS
uniref:Uncharacterized protein n=1 Tax=Timema bartmani TaxID=61472 RepID=A0A7R9EXN7_9NEOP|nr:unnamed protein product [Timema bartmani]